MFLKYSLPLALLFLSCSGMESSENRRIRKLHEKKETIYRRQGEKFFLGEEATIRKREAYPWEKPESLPKKITEPFFHCRGSCVHPKKTILGENGTYLELEDCIGEEGHSLALTESKVSIAQILLTLLNYVQNKTKERVVITTGYRCKAHNYYADPSKKNRTSKHQSGMEVDFYVEKYEENPTVIVAWIMQYYREKAPSLATFSKQKTNERGLRHPGWSNQEIALWIHEKDEGRDFDNRHPYPYITIEVKEGK